jgi:hypothetical protein
MTDEKAGREKAEYPDDVFCEKCKLWFRSHELEPLPKDVTKIRMEKMLPPATGKCPICEEVVQLTPTPK